MIQIRCRMAETVLVRQAELLAAPESREEPAAMAESFWWPARAAALVAAALAVVLVVLVEWAAAQDLAVRTARMALTESRERRVVAAQALVLPRPPTNSLATASTF